MDERPAGGRKGDRPGSRRQKARRRPGRAGKPAVPGLEPSRALISKKAELDKRMEEMDKTILENRVMSPDVYKGKDAEELRSLARTAALKDAPGATVLKVNISKSDWQRESVVEWTDTTQTSVQYRVTDSIYAQVAVKIRSDVFLYTVYIGKDTIGGKGRSRRTSCTRIVCWRRTSGRVGRLGLAPRGVEPEGLDIRRFAPFAER